jgi:thiol-disulfide isomerase/thioredoxin
MGKRHECIMRKAAVHCALAIILLASSGCIGQNPPQPGVNGTLILSDGTVIPQDVCEGRGIENSVIVFHSPSCPACIQTVPVLEEIKNETGKDIEFLDMTSANDRQTAEKLGMMPDYIPAVVIKCRVYVGYKGKEEFLRLMGS